MCQKPLLNVLENDTLQPISSSKQLPGPRHSSKVNQLKKEAVTYDGMVTSYLLHAGMYINLLSVGEFYFGQEAGHIIESVTDICRCRESQS